MCFSVLGKLYHDCLLVSTNEFMLVIIDVDTEIWDLLRDDDVVSRIVVLVFAISTTGNGWQSYIYSFDMCVWERRTSECDVDIY
jgi:hypothetical protein